MTYQPDMDVIRSFEAVRDACDAADDEAIRRSFEELLDQIEGEPPPLKRLLEETGDGIEETSDESLTTDPVPDALATALDGAERYMFSMDEDDAGRDLEEAFEPLLTALELDPGDEERDVADETDAGGPVADPDPEPADYAPPPTLDEISGFLIQMDGHGQEEISRLRTMLRRVLETGDLPVPAQDALNAAVDELAEASPDDESSLERALGRVGERIEDAMDASEVTSEAASEQRGQDGASPDHDPEPRPSDEGRDYASGLPEDSDPELLTDFIEESTEQLVRAEDAVLALEEDPDDAEAVNVLFRAFHTIKGSSGFLGLDRISDLSHRAETVFDRVREGEVAFTPAAADLALRSIDVLERLLAGVGEALEEGTLAVPDSFVPMLDLLEASELDERIESGDLEVPAADAGPAGSDPSGEDSSDAPGNDSVRVSTDRLDRLVDLVGELVVSHSMIAEHPALRKTGGELGKTVKRSEKILRDLQDLSTSMRMVPLRRAFRRISRVVRDVSRETGKPVNLTTQGEDTELDRNMVDVIADPLVHMARNAVDHGIEPPEERRAAGKPEEGTVRLSARQEGGNVVIEIADDGAGMSRDAIARKAMDRGIIDSDDGMSDEDVYRLIFEPGFSTADEVTDVSGRGVGMDVVKSSVESLRGRIEIESTPGEGSVFSIHLPLTLALTDGMLLRVGDERFILPTVSIQVSVRPEREEISTVAGRGEMVRVRDELIPLARLHRLYGIGGAETDPTQALLVVVGEGERATAFLVDELLGQKQFVVKALSGEVGNTPGLAGGAVLGDGEVGLILDAGELIDLAQSAPPESEAGGEGSPSMARAG